MEIQGSLYKTKLTFWITLALANRLK